MFSLPQHFSLPTRNKTAPSCNSFSTFALQVLWPRHCVQNSWGAELHKELKVHPKARVVYKGVNPAIDSYSAFFDNAKLGKTCLEELIRDEGCTDVYVCGIATDVCVGMRKEEKSGKRIIKWRL